MTMTNQDEKRALMARAGYTVYECVHPLHPTFGSAWGFIFPGKASTDLGLFENQERAWAAAEERFVRDFERAVRLITLVGGDDHAPVAQTTAEGMRTLHRVANEPAEPNEALKSLMAEELTPPPEHKFKLGEHVAIVGGQYYGENGKVVELLRSGNAPVYAIKVLTGPDCDKRGSTVITQLDLRAE